MTRDRDKRTGKALYYDNEMKHGTCARCNKFWKPEEQLPYVTTTGKTYNICPSCQDKHPLRKTPRKRVAFRKRYPPKRY